jgi:SAM-dependent methyltransferase
VPAYDRFAPYFDAWQRAFGGPYDDLILSRLLALFDRYAPGARRVADLGSGTGDLVVALARRGFTVVGVDVSRPMLEMARAKIEAAGLAHPPELTAQDIRVLALDPPVEAACCVYTVVNQLVGDGDLDRLLAAVARSLVPGGLFAFEVNLPAAYGRFWTGVDVVEAGGTRIRRSHHTHPGGRVLEAEVTIETGDGRIRHDRIPQRPYGDAELEAAATRAGYAVCAVERFDPFADTGEPTKALWAVQRGRA